MPKVDARLPNRPTAWQRVAGFHVSGRAAPHREARLGARDPIPLTGVLAIDREHEELVDRYRLLLRALNNGCDATAFAVDFCALLCHARSHFETEERIMEASGYGEYGLHVNEHKKLMRDGVDFLHSIIVRFSADDCLAVARFFKYWLFNHIETHDKKLGDFVAREGLASLASASSGCDPDLAG